MALKYISNILSAAGNDNTNASPNNIILTTNDAKFYVSVVRDNHKLSKPLTKGFERSVY